MKRPSNNDDRDGPPQKKIATAQSSHPQPCQPDPIQDVSPHESGSAPRAIGFQSGQRAPSRQSSGSSSGIPLPLPIAKGKTISTARRTGGAPLKQKPPAGAPVEPQVAGTPTPPTTPIVESTEKLRGVLEKIRAIQPPSTAAPTKGENSSIATNVNSGDAPPPPTQSLSIITDKENEPTADENSPSGKRLIVKLPLPIAHQTSPGNDVDSTSLQNSTHDQPLPNDTSIIPLPEKTPPLALTFPSDASPQASPSDGDEVQDPTEELPECRPGLIAPPLPTRPVCQKDPDKYCTGAFRKLALAADKTVQDVVKAVSNVLKRRDEAFQEYILKLEQENENQMNLLKKRDEHHSALTAEVEDMKRRLQETIKAQSQVEKEAEKLRATAKQIGERMSKFKAEGEEKDEKVQSLHARLKILEEELKAVTEERDKFKKYYTRHKEIDSELGM